MGKPIGTQHNTFGSAYGILVLLSKWLTIIVILFLSEALLRYGFVGGVGYIFIVMLSFAMFGMVSPRIKAKFHHKTSMDEVIAAKCLGSSRHIFWLFIFLTGFGMLLLQSFAIHLMVGKLFNIHPVFIQVLIYVICFLFLAVGGLKWVLQISPVYVTVIFISVILIPVYFFIHRGIEPVYDGIWLYHPYLLFWKNHDSFFFVFSSLFLIISVVMTDRATWNRLFFIQQNKVRVVFSLGGVILGSIMLSILSMIFISLSKHGYQNPAIILFDLIDRLESPAMGIIFITFCFIVAAMSIIVEVESLLSFLCDTIFAPVKKHVNKRGQAWMRNCLLGILLGMVLVCSIYTPRTIMPSVYVYGVITASMATPMFMVIYGKNSLPAGSVYGMLLAAAAGIAVLQFFQPEMGILAAFGLSFVITVVVYVRRWAGE